MAVPSYWRSPMAAKSTGRPFPTFRGRSGPLGGHGWPQNRLAGHFQRPVTTSASLAVTHDRENRTGGHFRRFVAAPPSWWPRVAAKSTRRPFPASCDRFGLLAVTHDRETDSPATSDVSWPPCWRSRMAAKPTRRPLPVFRDRFGLQAVTHDRETGSTAIIDIS